MSAKLRALLVEDSEKDAQLVLEALRRDGFNPTHTRVQTAAAMQAALSDKQWDVILCDNSMPGFDALSALRLMHQMRVETPFIIVSGTIGEEEAVGAIKQGATDYLLKDRLMRLGSAVGQALEQSRQRQERKEVEMVGQAINARLRAFIDHNPAFIFIKDTEGRYLHVNHVFERMFQLEFAQVVGKTDKEIFSAEQAAAFQANDQQVLQTGQSLQFEEQAQCHDGLHVCIVFKFPLRDAAGRITGLCGIATDITTRKRTEEALRAAQETVQTIFDSAPVAILGLDLEGRITSWNAGATRMFGWNEAEVLRKICPTVPTDGRDDFHAMIGRITRQGPQTGMIFPRQKKSGELIQASLSAAPLHNSAGQVVGVMVILEDITVRLQAQKALEISEQVQRQLAEQLAGEKARLEAAQAVAKIGSWETDLHTGVVSWSEETHHIFATEPASFQPSHAGFLQRVHPDDRAMVEQAFTRSLSLATSCIIEHRLLPSDGPTKIVEERWRVFFDQNGKASRAVGTCQDITDRKQAEAALRESEESFRTIFEQAGIGIALVDVTDGRILKCNQALAEMFGRSREELCEMTVEEVSVPDDYLDDRRQWTRMLAGEIPRFQMEKRYRHKDGSVIWGLLTSTVVRDAGGTPQFIIGMVKSITERKRAEAERRDTAQQLHALVVRLNTVREEEAKRIARELHDDLGQQLTALNMEINRLQGRPAGPATNLQAELSRMQAGVDHMIQVVQKIAGELRLGQLDLLGLPAAIEAELREFQKRSGLQCAIIRLDEVAGLGEAEATAVFRIMQESLTNIARHAGASRVELSLRAEAGQLSLEVSDNGRGITAVQLADRQAFGLLGMRERAEALGGKFSIEGRPGQGTVIRFNLPWSQRN